MKNLLILFFFCTFTQNLFSQATTWSPFPLNLANYYETSEGLVQCLKADESYLDGMVRVHSFQKNLYTMDQSPCATTIAESYGQAALDNVHLHSGDLLGLPNGFWASVQGTDTLFFNPNAAIGETVISKISLNTADEIRFYCALEETIQFYGQDEQTKQFQVSLWKDGNFVASALDFFPFVLSENHGFLAFVPFYFLGQEQFDAHWTHIGFEKNQNKMGFTPSIEIFTSNYAVGDVLYFTEERNTIFPFDYYCYSDSILAIERVQGRVKLIVHRNEIMVEEEHSASGISYKLEKSVYDTSRIIDNALWAQYFSTTGVNNLYITEIAPSLTGFGATKLKKNANNSYDYTNVVDGNSFDLANCMPSIIAEYYAIYSWNSALGFTSYYGNSAFNAFSSVVPRDFSKLTAYKKNGQFIYDDVNKCDFTSAIFNSKQDKFSVAIFPNPVFDNALTIELSKEAELPISVQVYSMDGALVYTHQQALASAKNTISLESTLPQGLYVLKMQDKNGAIALKKIIIE